MTKLKTIKVIGRARFLFYDLLGRYQFSDDDENRIIRCAADLSECIKEITEDDTQAEIDQLKTTLKNLKELMLDPDCVGDRGDIYVMVRAIDKALNGESEGK